MESTIGKIYHRLRRTAKAIKVKHNHNPHRAKSDPKWKKTHISKIKTKQQTVAEDSIYSKETEVVKIKLQQLDQICSAE